MREVNNQNLTLEEVKGILVKAHKHGAEAAASKLEQLRGENTRSTDILGLYGGSYIEIKLDGRSRLASQLKLATKQLDDFTYKVRGYNGLGVLSFVSRTGRQELEISEAGSKAALAIVTTELQVVGYVHTYYT